jgi:hypothetical protein
MRVGSIPPRRSNFIPSGPHRQGSETVNLVAPGSNPGLGAICARAEASRPVSKAGVRGSVTYRACECRGGVVIAGVCKTSLSGFDSQRHFHGGRGPLAKSARCDRAQASSILVGHPSPHSTVAVQPPCKRKAVGANPTAGTRSMADHGVVAAAGSDPAC